MLHEALKDLIGPYKRPSELCNYMGQAMGSITIASHLALLLEGQCSWSLKASNETMQVDPRFSLSQDILSIIVEDVTTTGGTTSRTIDAVRALGVPLAPYIYTVVNRSGKTHVEDFEIRALVTLDIQAWEFGNNPFTQSGMELVEPVYPKQKSGAALTAIYD
jgi:orotate phosphoribosyltransferase